MRRMKALRVEQQQLRISDVPIPLPDNEVLVRVTLSGICNTDLEIARGYAGFEGTLGHEFVGVIESLPNPESPAASDQAQFLRAGQRVVGEINAGCDECVLCRAGDPRHCPRRTVLGILG